MAGDQILHGLLEFGRVRVVLDEHYATAPTKPMKSGERLERGRQHRGDRADRPCSYGGGYFVLRRVPDRRLRLGDLPLDIQ
jgi:hypothetical protein